MPRLIALLITPNAPPLETSFRAKKDDVMDSLRQLINSKGSFCVTTGDLGVLYSPSEVDAELNPLASAVVNNKNAKKLSAALGEIKGRCILLGEDDKGNVISMDKANISKVWDLYQQLSGQPVKSRSQSANKKPGPRRAKRALDFYSKDFQKSRRAELANQNIVPNMTDITKEAQVAWNTSLSYEEKAPYLAMAAEDKIRFDREQAEFLKENPVCPKSATTAYSVYCKQNPDKTTRPDWKTLTEEQKQPYELAAKQDLLRYENDLDVFKKHCDANGRDFAQVMASKKRKSTSAPTSDGKAKLPKTKGSKKTKASTKN